MTNELTENMLQIYRAKTGVVGESEGHKHHREAWIQGYLAAEAERNAALHPGDVPRTLIGDTIDLTKPTPGAPVVP